MCVRACVCACAHSPEHADDDDEREDEQHEEAEHSGEDRGQHRVRTWEEIKLDVCVCVFLLVSVCLRSFEDGASVLSNAANGTEAQWTCTRRPSRALEMFSLPTGLATL